MGRGKGKKRGPRLHDLKSIKQELGHIYRLTRLGELEVAETYKLSQILAILARLISGQEIETRVEELEKELANGKRT